MAEDDRQASPSPVADHGEEGPSLSRIEAFSDGVMAIAITLLVLNISVPPEVSDLGRRLEEQGPELFAYALSFAVIARLWMVHHRFFDALARSDTRLIALNMLFLALIALIPFTSEMIGTHGGESLAVVTYALVLSAAGLTHWANLRHAVAAGLVAPERHADTAAFARSTSLIWIGVFVSSIPVAFISAQVATLMWILALVVHPRLMMKITVLDRRREG